MKPYQTKKIKNYRDQHDAHVIAWIVAKSRIVVGPFQLYPVDDYVVEDAIFNREAKLEARRI